MQKYIKKLILAQKRAIFRPQKRAKGAKIDFSLKRHFLHFLAKFKKK